MAPPHTNKRPAPNEPATRDAERDKLVAEILAAFNFASTASLFGAMSAALAVAEAAFARREGEIIKERDHLRRLLCKEADKVHAERAAKQGSLS